MYITSFAAWRAATADQRAAAGGSQPCRAPWGGSRLPQPRTRLARTGKAVCWIAHDLTTNELIWIVALVVAKSPDRTMICRLALPV